MFRLFNKLFSALLTFSGSLRTKSMYLDNKPCMAGPTLIGFNFVEFDYCPFMIK